MVIVCSVTSLTITSQVLDTTYTLNQGSLLTATFTVIQTDACQFPYTYTHSYLKAGLAIAAPAWISFDPLTQKFTMTVTSPADIDTYTVTSTATIP